MAFSAPKQFPLRDYDRGGSLTLRSNHMNYSRAILNSNWHQAREAEPKDYDINRSDVRDFSKATYKRIGNITDEIPNTTYQDHVRQIFDKKKYEEQEVHKSMVTEETYQHAKLDRETGLPKDGFGSVLPRHHPDYDKIYLESTHQADFKAPYPLTAKPKETEIPDHANAFKRCHSQFTDTADYRRPGRNTWQDESGLYANTHYKRQVPEYRPSKITCD